MNLAISNIVVMALSIIDNAQKIQLIKLEKATPEQVQTIIDEERAFLAPFRALIAGDWLEAQVKAATAAALVPKD